MNSGLERDSDFKSLQFFKEKVGGNMYIINDSD